MKHLCTNKILMWAAALLLMLALAGCSEKESKPVDLPALSAQLDAQFTDELLELNDSTLGEYYNLDLSFIKQYVVRKSATGATAQELALFEAIDAAGADAAEAAVRERIEDQKFNYESYLPAEMPKIENSVVIRSGNYVFFACAEDDAAARSLLQDALK